MAKRTKILKVRDKCIVAARTNYQGFVYDTEKNVCTPTNARMKKKWAAVEAVFPDLVRGRSFLDIGACFGFFCFKALEHGARLPIGLEMNENFYRPVADALLELRISGKADSPGPWMAWIKKKWPTDVKADVVMAMSVLQYIFPDLSLTGFLDRIKWSARVAALVEFPRREDSTVIKEGWLDDHQEYTRANFEALARERFASVECLGLGHTNTRHVYLLRKAEYRFATKQMG
jgi:hypothetical protein